jgi:hypothetical protein
MTPPVDWVDGAYRFSRKKAINYSGCERRDLFQRAFAALEASSRRSDFVIVSRRLLPPIKPPRHPISLMNADTCAAVGSSDAGIARGS